MPAMVLVRDVGLTAPEVAEVAPKPANWGVVVPLPEAAAGPAMVTVGAEATAAAGGMAAAK